MKPFLSALQGQTLSTPPVWLMRQAGRYLPEYRATREQAGGFLDLCYNPELATEVTLQPLRRYGFDAAILFSDILVVPDALGQSVRFQVGEGPLLEALESAADLEKLSMDGFHDHLAPVYETVKGIKANLGQDFQETALIGFAGAPWTVATYMVEGKGSKDYAKTKAWAYGQPELFQKVIDLLVEGTSEYLINQVNSGAEALQIFDSWAGVLPEKEFHKWVSEPIGRIVAAVKAVHPDTPIIGFPRGAAMLYPEFIRQTKVDGVSLDTAMSCSWAAENIQPLCTVQGNLDPILTIAGGEAMDQAVDHIIETLGQGPFIFNLGHGITPPTPPENVTRLVERVRSKTG